MTKEQMEERFRKAFNQRRQYGPKRDRQDQDGTKRDRQGEYKRRIKRHWTEPWVAEWLDEFDSTRPIFEAIIKVCVICDFGTAALLVNQKTLARVQDARANPVRGRSTEMTIRAEDWRAVRKCIEEDAYTPVRTDEAALAICGARLGKYYFVEADEGAVPARCEGAWAAAVAQSFERDDEEDGGKPAMEAI